MVSRWMPQQLVALPLALAVLVSLAACSSSSSKGATPTDSNSGSANGPCNYIADGTAARKVGRPPSTPESSTKLTLAMQVGTSNTLEPIDITLTPGATPCTVNSIAFLADAKYFDNTTCPRLTTQGIFVLQCGDPTGTGAGGPGYRFADELSGSETYPAGTVAMANSGPNTNGSQFFLVYRDTSLPPSYTVFGHITAGLAVLLKEAKGGSESKSGPGDGPPRITIRIASARAG